MPKSFPFRVVIPARYASSRLPGKALLSIAGKSMIQHVFERALLSDADEVLIATDDSRIQAAAEGFGARVVMTDPRHQSGTDRIAEVAALEAWAKETVVVNVQGDEPLILPALINQVANLLSNERSADMATLCSAIHSLKEVFDPSVVKVVFNCRSEALYFSRAPIPWQRDAFAADPKFLPQEAVFYRHIGLYAYRVGYLANYLQLVQVAEERAESLEQLRALINGYKILVQEAHNPPEPGVDTLEDLQRVRQHFALG